MSRIALIVNPFASSVTDERVAAVERALREAGKVTTFRTERPRHATELVAERARGYDAVVVFSGDGGFNEAVNGASSDVAFGFVPGGGTSVFPRALGLPREPEAAAQQVAAALRARRMRRISLGRANGRRFTFSAGVGLDAELVRRVEAHGRDDEGRRKGDVAFALTAARLLIEHRGQLDPQIEIVDHGRVAFALVANCDPYTYVGAKGLRIAPLARFELGVDIVAPRRVRPELLPRLAGYAFLGRGQTHDPNVLYLHDVDRVEIRCDAPTPLQLDGEDLGDVTELEIESERGALDVLV